MGTIAKIVFLRFEDLSRDPYSTGAPIELHRVGSLEILYTVAWIQTIKIVVSFVVDEDTKVFTLQDRSKGCFKSD